MSISKKLYWPGRWRPQRFAHNHPFSKSFHSSPAHEHPRWTDGSVHREASVLLPWLATLGPALMGQALCCPSVQLPTCFALWHQRRNTGKPCAQHWAGAAPVRTPPVNGISKASRARWGETPAEEAISGSQEESCMAAEFGVFSQREDSWGRERGRERGWDHKVSVLLKERKHFLEARVGSQLLEVLTFHNIWGCRCLNGRTHFWDSVSRAPELTGVLCPLLHITETLAPGVPVTHSSYEMCKRVSMDTKWSWNAWGAWVVIDTL